MNLADAQTLLLEKMAGHGMVDLGWTMNWDEAGKRFGCCSVGKKVISLSRPLTEANPESEVVDTILHEIAHALADLEHGEKCGHDERWKAVCRRIGARPEACYGDDEVVIPGARWVLAHAETGEVFASYLRRPDKDVTRMFWGVLGVMQHRAVAQILEIAASLVYPPFAHDGDSTEAGRALGQGRRFEFAHSRGPRPQAPRQGSRPRVCP